MTMAHQDFTSLPPRNQLEKLRGIARGAAVKILSVYERAGSPAVNYKADQSPITEADRLAHDHILAALTALTPDWPVLSEESDPVPYAERRHWTRYWLVDPLDGTKEFLQRNGEFTVNIALIDSGHPRLGLVHVPVTDVSFGGAVAVSECGGSALKWTRQGCQPIQVKPVLPAQADLHVVASRNHRGDGLEAMLECLRARFARLTQVNMGSSLKICLVAEGLADLYPRLAPTSEWDTAAAHAVLAAAGGALVDLDFLDLTYNRKPDLLNPAFIAFGDRQVPWQTLCGLEPPAPPG
ncbi:MAG: 3(2),5-bisphosphate nucleotidase CysQ [Pseudomonadota bacterium]|jgi:3'(2'), 5'-bisphosphate nucleotidase